MPILVFYKNMIWSTLGCCVVGSWAGKSWDRDREWWCAARGVRGVGTCLWWYPVCACRADEHITACKYLSYLHKLESPPLAKSKYPCPGLSAFAFWNAFTGFSLTVNDLFRSFWYLFVMSSSLATGSLGFLKITEKQLGTLTHVLNHKNTLD